MDERLTTTSYAVLAQVVVVVAEGIGRVEQVLRQGEGDAWHWQPIPG